MKAITQHSYVELLDGIFLRKLLFFLIMAVCTLNLRMHGTLMSNTARCWFHYGVCNLCLTQSLNRLTPWKLMCSAANPAKSHSDKGRSALHSETIVL